MFVVWKLLGSVVFVFFFFVCCCFVGKKRLQECFFFESSKESYWGKVRKSKVKSWFSRYVVGVWLCFAVGSRCFWCFFLFRVFI